MVGSSSIFGRLVPIFVAMAASQALPLILQVGTATIHVSTQQEAVSVIDNRIMPVTDFAPRLKSPSPSSNFSRYSDSTAQLNHFLWEVFLERLTFQYCLISHVSQA